MRPVLKFINHFSNYLTVKNSRMPNFCILSFKFLLLLCVLAIQVEFTHTFLKILGD